MKYLRIVLLLVLLLVCLTECFKLAAKEQKKQAEETKQQMTAQGDKHKNKEKKPHKGENKGKGGGEKKKSHAKEKKEKKSHGKEKAKHTESSKLVMTTEEFKLSVEEDDITFIMFYAPWCGFCKRVAPIWEKLAQKFNDNDEFDKVITIGKIDCTSQIAVCYDNDIQSYPTLILYKNQGESIEYEGEHELEGFETFIMTHLNEDEHGKNGLLDLNEDNFDRTVEDGYSFVDFYATWCPNCAKVEPMWETLAETFKLSNVKIARIECSRHESICDLYEIDGYPTLLLFHDGKIIGNYNSAPSHESFLKFITEKVPDLNMDFLEEDLPGELYEIAQSNYTEFMKFKGLVFIEFYTTWCTYCRNLEPIWKELAAKYVSKDPVRISRMDCTPNGPLCKKNNVSIYPTLMLFKDGQRLEDYNGATDLKTLYRYVQSKLSALSLHEL